MAAPTSAATTQTPELAAGRAQRRAELQALCRELGVIYSTRARNEHAKAGNMSAALEKLTAIWWWCSTPTTCRRAISWRAPSAIS